MSNRRKVVVVRHGERVDFTFNTGGIHWTKRAFDDSARYRPFNLNMPRNLPKRQTGPDGFKSDTPLTEIGYLQSKLIGRAFRDRGYKYAAVYCSPSLRCIQTAIGILKGMNDNQSQLNIEPGLFEWMRFCRDGRPSWLTNDEAINAGYPVNNSYIPHFEVNDLKMMESLEDYYDRSFAITKKLLDNHPTGNILLVAHGASLDTCTRQLSGKPPRSGDSFFDILQRTPYLSTVEAEETASGHFEILGSPVPSLAHSANSAYDSAMLKAAIETNVRT
jgi:ubiquitin-associated SH3 domain-containing protein